MRRNIGQVILLTVVSLAGCGGSSELPPQRQGTQLMGVAQLGRVAGADVRVLSFLNGHPGLELGSTVTNDDGTFVVDLHFASQPILVTVDNGQYVEESGGTLVRVRRGDGLKALVQYESGKPLTVSVTPFSHAVAGLAENLIANGMTVSDAIFEANKTLSDVFGVDLTATLPRDIRSAGQAEEGLDDSTLYGFLVGSLSSYSAWISDRYGNGTHQDFNSLGLAQILYKDINSDGVLNGIGAGGTDNGGSQLMFAGVALDADVYRGAIAQHMLVVAGSPGNATGITAAALLGQASTLAAANAPVIPGNTIPKLDFEGPKIQINLTAGTYYRGVLHVPVTATDESPVRSITFDVDGVVLGDATDVAEPSFDINTLDSRIKNSDGPHTIGVTAFDDVGNIGSATINVSFDNTKPAVVVESPGIVNKTRYVMTGTYDLGGSAVKRFLVQSRNAQFTPDGKWQATLDLKAGNNVVPISVEDEAGNETTLDTLMTVDLVPPNFSGSRISFSSEVLFSLGVGQCFLDALENATASGPPLYFNRQKLSLSTLLGGKTQYSSLDLEALQVPYLRFYVTDPSVNGIFTPAGEIKVRMQYGYGGKILVPWRELAVHDDPTSFDPYYLIPITTETLHSDLVKATATDIHQLSIEIEDAAGNIRRVDFQFRIHVGDADCVIS